MKNTKTFEQVEREFKKEVHAKKDIFKLVFTKKENTEGDPYSLIAKSN